jgi:hypothetical protein
VSYKLSIRTMYVIITFSGIPRENAPVPPDSKFLTSKLDSHYGYGRGQLTVSSRS